jgi:shikimate dehydrogenase
MKDGRLCGTTTDPIGFYKALESAGHVLGGDNVVILGSGGTARTLATALLLDNKCRTLVIAARSVNKARALVSSLKKLVSTKSMGYCELGVSDKNTRETFSRCSLLVNCTSVGMSPNIDETPLDKIFFQQKMMVFDAIYNPTVTRFLREAAEAGCKTQNGLWMLLYQGLESFRYWTGVDAPAELFTEEQLQALVAGGEK